MQKMEIGKRILTIVRGERWVEFIGSILERIPGERTLLP